MTDYGDSVSELIKSFLNTQEIQPSGQANVVFDDVCVEGGGKGVSRSIDCFNFCLAIMP